MLKLLKKHHPLFLMQTAWNRFTPAGLLRARRFGVFELRAAEGWPEPRQVMSHRDDGSLLRFEQVERPEVLDQVNALTGVDPLDVCTSTHVFAAFKGSEVVGGVYLKPASFLERELGLEIVLPDNSLWMFSTAVQKDFRRQGIYTSLLGAVRRCPEICRQTIYFSVDMFNRPSLKAHEKFVEREIGRFSTLRLLQFGWTTGPSSFLIRATTRNCRRNLMRIDLAR